MSAPLSLKSLFFNVIFLIIDKKSKGKSRDIRDDLNFEFEEELEEGVLSPFVKHAHRKYCSSDDDDLSDTEVAKVRIITQVSTSFHFPLITLTEFCIESIKSFIHII